MSNPNTLPPLTKPMALAWYETIRRSFPRPVKLTAVRLPKPDEALSVVRCPHGDLLHLQYPGGEVLRRWHENAGAIDLSYEEMYESLRIVGEKVPEHRTWTNGTAEEFLDALDEGTWLVTPSNFADVRALELRGRHTQCRYISTNLQTGTAPGKSKPKQPKIK